MKRELKKRGVKGILVYATDFEEYMHHKHFEKQGFKTVKECGPFKLMYYPLTRESVRVKQLELNYKPSRNKVEVTLFRNFFCPVSAYMYELVKKVAQSFGDEVKIVEIEGTLENARKYGTTDPLFNGKIRAQRKTFERLFKRRSTSSRATDSKRRQDSSRNLSTRV